MPEEPQELTSENISVSITRKPDCMVELSVKAKKPVIDKAYDKAVKEVSKEVSIPGFRKGKAPQQLIISKYDSSIEERWKKTIADISFQESAKLAKTPPLNQDSRISFDLKSHSKEEAEMTFAYEAEPLIPEIKFDKLELSKEEAVEITEEKVEETIRQLQLFFAKFNIITERPAKDGDFVVIDVDIIDEDPPQKALTSARFEVTEKGMAKWMRELILGMKAGESKEGTSLPDEDAIDEHKTPEKKVKLTIISIQEPDLPKVNDELAKKVGCETVEIMKKNLDTLLNKQALEQAQKIRREKISDVLIELYPFDLPKTLVDRETQYRLKQVISDPVYTEKLRGMNEEQQKEFIASIKTQGERAVRLFYLCRSIVQKNSLSLNPEEINSQAKTPLEVLFGEGSTGTNSQTETQEQKALTMSKLMLTKAQDFALEKLDGK